MGEYLPGKMQERVRELRDAHGYNQSKLAEVIGVDRSTIGRIENGDIKKISTETLVKMSKLFNVPTDYILGLSDTPENTGYDIKELGLSVEAAKNLYTKKVDPVVLNKLLLNDKFAFATKLMVQYFSGFGAMMRQTQNTIVDFNYKLLEEMNRTGKIPNDSLIKETKRKIKASGLPDTQMDIDRIHRLLMAALREIKEECISEVRSQKKQDEILNYEIMERVKNELMSVPNIYNLPRDEKITFTRDAIIHSISMAYDMDDREMAEIIPVIEQVTPLIIDSWEKKE